MTLSRAEAEGALADVARTRRRAFQFAGYRQSGRHLQLWGVVWCLGYGLPAAMPDLSLGWLWAILDLAGMFGSGVIVWRMRGVAADGPALRIGRMVASIALVFLFIAATFAVMHPIAAAAYRVYPALVLGLVYGLIGVFVMPRFLWVALLIAGGSLAAFFFAPTLLSPAIALFGGGGLFCGGLWMARS